MGWRGLAVISGRPGRGPIRPMSPRGTVPGWGRSPQWRGGRAPAPGGNPGRPGAAHGGPGGELRGGGRWARGGGGGEGAGGGGGGGGGGGRGGGGRRPAVGPQGGEFVEDEGGAAGAGPPLGVDGRAAGRQPDRRRRGQH